MPQSAPDEPLLAPVVDRAGRPTGAVAVGDVFALCSAELESLARLILENLPEAPARPAARVSTGELRPLRLPLQIQFLGMDRSEALEAAVRSRAARLERLAPDISACRVALELAQKHSRQGRPVSVRIDLTLPGRELVVDRVADEDAYVALRDAFDDMRRRLDEAVRQQRGELKTHPERLDGVIDRLDAEGGFGFIRTAQGGEYYFGRASLANGDFERVAPGMAVRFIVEAAAEGLQAHRVSLVRTRTR